MKSALKHSFNTAVCIVGSSLSGIAGISTALDASKLYEVLTTTAGDSYTHSYPASYWAENVAAGLAYTAIGLALFAAGYSRFSRKEKTDDLPGIQKNLKAAFHLTSAYAGSAIVGLTNAAAHTLFYFDPTPENIAKMAFGLALFSAGYSRVLSKNSSQNQDPPLPTAPHGPA